MGKELGSVELRPYQDRDVTKFLDVPACLVAYGKRGGKTITALALTLERWDRNGDGRPILVVSDKDSPWMRDLRKIGFPENKIHRIFDGEESAYRRKKARERFRSELLNEQPGHIYQVHWAALTPELELLLATRWHTIIADEAHAAKNRKSGRTLALKRLRAEYKIGLTADPDDNAPQDIWSLLNWLYPKRYRSYWKWVRKYIEIYEESGPKGDYFTFGEPINVEEFRREIEPFFVYMPLEEIDPGQLSHIYEEHHVRMTEVQRVAYEQMVEWQMMQLGDDTVIAEWPMVAAMRLQQLAQAMGIATTKQVWRWVTENDPDTGERKRERRLVDTISVRQIEPSPKLDDLIETLQCTKPRPEFDPANIPGNAGELLRGTAPGPTVIFTQFPDILRLACARMDKAGIKYVSVRQSAEVNSAEAAFQNGEVDVLIGTIGIISESIELSRLQTEIFIDCPWNPRVRGQAEARGQEYGKRDPIRIIDIRTKDSVDFERLDVVRTKQEWKDALLGRGERSHDAL